MADDPTYQYINPSKHLCQPNSPYIVMCPMTGGRFLPIQSARTVEDFANLAAGIGETVARFSDGTALWFLPDSRGGFTPYLIRPFHRATQ